MPAEEKPPSPSAMEVASVEPGEGGASREAPPQVAGGAESGEPPVRGTVAIGRRGRGLGRRGHHRNWRGHDGRRRGRHNQPRRDER